MTDLRQPRMGDGAKGTALQEAGLPLGDAPERWNLERPEAVRAVHAAHAAARTAWVVTNSFGGNRGRLRQAGLEHRLREVNAAAVRCAREGAPGLPVLGSLGPTGLPPEEWEPAYREQVEALTGAGVDGFLVETAVALREAEAAIRAAAAADSGPVWGSFTPAADGCLLDGKSPEEAAEAWATAGGVVVGVNCGSGPESLLEPVRRLAAAGIAPVYAAPSAGLPELRGGRAVYPIRPDEFAWWAERYLESGATLLAGCCGVGAEHLTAAGAVVAGFGTRDRQSSTL
jgi:5-methyltetrahydrofolate--homocysteine methyltransferase